MNTINPIRTNTNFATRSSMVNFQARKKFTQLSNKDLNYISESLSGTNFSGEEIAHLKQGLVDTINAHRWVGFSSMLKKASNGCDESFPLIEEILSRIQKKNPDINTERYANLLNCII